MDLVRASATEIAGAIAQRAVSSREVLAALLARIDEVNPTVNAVVALDVERAQRWAAEADEAVVRGDELGPLHGVPMTVKDVFETEGFVTTSGAPELRDHVPATDALAVARLKAAGAIVFGKSNTPMYAGDLQTYNDVYGVTSNPWDAGRMAGGSSGGSGAAVAACMAPLELGSDIGGSIRIPAHCNGVYGLKPSWGVVPNRGHIPGPPGSLLETDVNCNGPLARSLEDLALGLSVIAGPGPEDAVAWRLELDPGPPVGDVSTLRIATVFSQGAEVVPLSARVRGALEAFAGRLAGAGAQVDAVPLPVPLREGFRSWAELVLPIIGLGLSEDEFSEMLVLDDIPGEDDQVVSGRALVCRYRRWAHADQRRQEHRRAWAELFDRYDVVLAPVFPTTAFPHDVERPFIERTLDIDGRQMSHHVLMAWCGAIGPVKLPVVALPTGPAEDGLPVGVQVIGPYLSDRRLLAIAGRLEEAVGSAFALPA